MALTSNSRLEVLQVYKLLQSVRQQDTAQIKALCSQGVPMLINYRDPQKGECALHIAAQINDDVLTKFLLSLGAYPNVQDQQGRTPIMRAADFGHVTTVEALVKVNADLKIKDENGQDVIIYCFSSSTERHKRCLDIVLSNGAEVNNTLDSERPTLVSACESADENEESCLSLIERGADPNARNKNGKSALAEACSRGSVAVVKALLNKGADPNTKDKRQLTPLHYAAEKGSLGVVKSLVAYGADLKAVDKEMNNPLHLAAEGGFGMVCKFLGQRGCNPKEKNRDGFTPRLLAKEKSSKEAVKELRKAEKLFTKYSKPEAVNPNSPNILHFYDWICEREDYVRDLLTKAAKPTDEPTEKNKIALSQQDFCDVMKKINAPLTEEIEKRIFEAHDTDSKKSIIVEEFLTGKKYISKIYLMSAFEAKKKKGKKGKKKGKGKKSKFKIPLPICTDKDGPRRPDGGPPEKYLEKQFQWTDHSRFNRNAPPVHPMQDDSAWYLPPPSKQYISISDAVKFEDFETLKRAFEDGLDVDARDKYFKTPLMASCAEGNVKFSKYLLALGASVEARDNFKWTPLHHACHSGQLDVVQILLYAGADGNAVTWNGATPLMRAIESGKISVVKFLLDCNVSVTMINKKEKSAVDIAREWGNADIYELVKEKYEAAPKPKKDKKGNIRHPPPQPIVLPGLSKNGSLQLPAILKFTSGNLNLEERPGSAPNPLYFKTQVKNNVRRVGHLKTKRTVVDFSLENFSRGEKRPREKTLFVPRKAWIDQPTVQQVIDEKKEKRIRFGENVDFEDYAKPLKQNIDAKINEVTVQT